MPSSTRARRAVRLCTALGAVLAFWATACTCAPMGLEGRRFACAGPQDCIPGFVCRGGECVATGSFPGDGGGEDAGLDGGPGEDAGVDGGPGEDAGVDGGVDGGADGGTDGGWWDARFAYRRRLVVVAGAAAVDAGYAVALVLDHASLVAGAKARADGQDLRIACRDGASWTELDRVLDTGAAWDSATTRLWFRFPTALPATSFDEHCYLHYGFPAAAAAPASPGAVFLFFDDFESGTLARWSPSGPLWEAATSQAHSGQWSLRHGGEADVDRNIFAAPPLEVADVYLDAWWRVDSDDVDLAQQVRVTNDGGCYETNLERDAGWDLAKFIGFTWTEVAANQSPPVVDTWTRVGLGVHGTSARVFRDGVQVVPPTGAFDLGSELASGSVGFRKWALPIGASWWVDDVVVRPWVDPEPTVLLGPEE